MHTVPHKLLMVNQTNYKSHLCRSRGLPHLYCSIECWTIRAQSIKQLISFGPLLASLGVRHFIHTAKGLAIGRNP